MEYNEEPNEQDPGEEMESGNTKQWLADNLRIIISVLIVVLIAGGIYSYSKRSPAPTQDQGNQNNVLQNITGSDQNASNNQPSSTPGGNNQAPTSVNQNNTSSTATSQETGTSFIETAGRGDSTTKLARRALADYLEKNPDSALTAEHKIYIEDYLRKNVPNKGSVHVGTSVEFSKDLVNNAISKSKSLNSNQLQNLHKYAVRVPSLS